MLCMGRVFFYSVQWVGGAAAGGRYRGGVGGGVLGGLKNDDVNSLESVTSLLYSREVYLHAGL